jgi:hypothetical protein
MNRELTALYRAIADSPSVSPVMLMEALFDSGYVRLWNGYGDITFDSNTYTGAANLIGVTSPKESVSLRANGVQVQLSGIPSDTVSLALAESCQGRPITIYLGFVSTDPDQVIEFDVTVSGGKYYIQLKQQPTLHITSGHLYKFNQSDSTNDTHRLRVSTTSDGTHNSGSQYTSGWTEVGTAGTAGAYSTWAVPSGAAASMYYYCQNHSGMGGAITIESQTILSNPMKMFAGIMDKMDISDDGESVIISVNAESRLIALENAKVRRYTEEDQKLSFPDDTSLDFVASIQDQEVVWGRG